MASAHKDLFGRLPSEVLQTILQKACRPRIMKDHLATVKEACKSWASIRGVCRRFQTESLSIQSYAATLTAPSQYGFLAKDGVPPGTKVISLIIKTDAIEVLACMDKAVVPSLEELHVALWPEWENPFNRALEPQRLMTTSRWDYIFEQLLGRRCQRLSVLYLVSGWTKSLACRIPFSWSLQKLTVLHLGAFIMQNSETLFPLNSKALPSLTSLSIRSTIGGPRRVEINTLERLRLDAIFALNGQMSVYVDAPQ
jgi:hypothetical protein